VKKQGFSVKVPDVAIAIAIAFSFAFLVVLGLYLLYPAPDYFFYEPASEAECIVAGGEWIEVEDDYYSYYPYCELGDEFYEQYYNSLDTFYLVISILYMAVGIAAFLLGMFFIKKKAVATGLLFGGLLVLFWNAVATLMFVPYALVSIAVVLLILLVAVYKKKPE